MTQTCKTCGSEKALDEFCRNRRTKTGRATRCRACDHDRVPLRREYFKTRGARPEVRRRQRNATLKHAFNISVDDYEAMLSAQGGRCANPRCRTDVPGGTGVFHIDHDHGCCPKDRSCGKCIRGLLCANCNLGLGNFKDNLTLLQGAIEYLQGVR